MNITKNKNFILLKVHILIDENRLKSKFKLNWKVVRMLEVCSSMYLDCLYFNQYLYKISIRFDKSHEWFIRLASIIFLKYILGFAKAETLSVKILNSFLFHSSNIYSFLWHFASNIETGVTFHVNMRFVTFCVNFVTFHVKSDILRQVCDILRQKWHFASSVTFRVCT